MSRWDDMMGEDMPPRRHHGSQRFYECLMDGEPVVWDSRYGRRAAPVILLAEIERLRTMVAVIYNLVELWGPLDIDENKI